MFINLLPANTRLKIQFRSMLRRFARIWAAAGVGALACAALQVRECWHASQRLAELEARCEPLYALQQQIQSDRRQLNSLQARCEMLSGLQPSDHFLDLMGVLVESTQREAGKLHIQRLSLQSSQQAAAAPQAPSRAAAASAAAGSAAAGNLVPIGTLSLNGLAEDDASLAQFVAALRETGVFDRVELKSSSQVAGGSKASRQYHLECRYEDLP
ncbi:MAG: PilN domain-containing protein [Aureliella sp.]